ncbi:HNH endonuclease [Clostridium sp. YIM B02551]|uniref:HNH endonuclease n=1 Tax=Clostridium sp. YIM B02551 TaxID=2910679 RepID=UPI001EEC6DEE|nr:HNH endonuclease signature motif containing protein [Clostridium sp. YIM B02551]
MKFCKCGKLIEYTQRLCSDCEVKQTARNKIKNKEYKNARQDEDIQSIYNSKKWKITVRIISNRDNGLCILCLSEGRLRYKDTVHHIVEVKEDISKAYVLLNLICLCESCHQKVHREYKINKLTKENMQNKLIKLIKDTQGV